MISKKEVKIEQKNPAKDLINSQIGSLPKAVKELYQRIKFYEDKKPLDKYTNDVMRALIDYQRNLAL